MKKVITYGTFDLIHKGHIRLLKRARTLGDHLTVCVSTDEFNALKGKKAYTSYEDRKYILEAIRYVDEVIPEKGWDQKIKDVEERHIDTFVMGDDWKGKFDFLKDYCKVIYLPRTEGISTTKIKRDLGLGSKNESQK
ncbi:Glycerol-3-phosphate cytidylyltransferase [Pediococcus damnosus]|uniref:glycerol-3-phosphate cytidylyltransferase n=1 Tax=Pediococcus damnosus TaxID=51663 RepID=UPI00078E135F|nr:glycerol-3-phosphate cytidylyltransferase [Pediococcus damnosus]AMV68585.1 Glycerol-3-phosphate cytidylyltransferase [Pediococcus damnosus]